MGCLTPERLWVLDSVQRRLNKENLVRREGFGCRGGETSTARSRHGSQFERSKPVGPISLHPNKHHWTKVLSSNSVHAWSCLICSFLLCYCCAASSICTTTARKCHRRAQSTRCMQPSHSAPAFTCTGTAAVLLVGQHSNRSSSIPSKTTSPSNCSSGHNSSSSCSRVRQRRPYPITSKAAAGACLRPCVSARLKPGR